MWRTDLNSPNSRINGVESVTSVLNRGLSLISDLERNHNNKEFLLVGHGDVLQILMTFQQGVDPDITEQLRHYETPKSVIWRN